MSTKSLRERVEDFLSGAYIRGYHKGQKDLADKARAEIQEIIEEGIISSGEQVGLLTALEIIDKCIGGKDK